MADEAPLEAAGELVVSVTETATPLPSAAASVETSKSDPPIKPSTTLEEVIEAEKTKTIKPRKVTGSVVLFKQESNVVSDLSDPEGKALDELKQLVLDALDRHELAHPPPPPAQVTEKDTSPPLPPPAAPEPTSKAPPSATHEAKIQTAGPEFAKEVAVIQESETEEKPSKEEVESPASVVATEAAEKSTAGGIDVITEITSSPEEVTIWGVPLLKDERSDVILLKFLRARDFKVRDAFVMLKNTIRWRKAFGIDNLIHENLGDDLEKVVFMHGLDKEGHPVCYNVYGEFQNKELYQRTFADAEKRMKFLQWRIQFLERSIRKFDFRPGGICTIFQISDLKNSPGPAKRELRIATREALQLLQDNYPEFVAKQVFINVPWWYLAFYTMISPFLTQRTKSKFVFAGPSKTTGTLFKYISPEQVPIQYGGFSVDFCECNPEFTTDDPATVITVKPATKQIVEIQVNEKCMLVWELRVVGWEVTYSAEFMPNAGYTVMLQKAKKMAASDEPVVCNSFKISELGKIVLAVDNPTGRKKKLLYRFKVKPLCE